MDESIIQQEINKYKKFKKVDGATYRKVNFFLRKRTYITAREWALARLCTDFRTAGGAEMTFIGKHLPELVPFMEDTYTPQAVNQARHSFKKKVRKASATFFYGAMCGFFTTDELDDILFEASEVSRFLLEVEGTTLDIDEEIDIEDRITKVMRSVGETAKTILKTRSMDSEPESKEQITPAVQSIPPSIIQDSKEERIPYGLHDTTPIDSVIGHRHATRKKLSSKEQKANEAINPVLPQTGEDSLTTAKTCAQSTESIESLIHQTIFCPPNNQNSESENHNDTLILTDEGDSHP